MSAPNALFLGVLILLMIPVVVIDLRERRIPNWLNLAIAASGIVHGMWHDPSWRALGLMLFQAGLVTLLLIGTTVVLRMLSRGARIGWGDLKFLAAAALWVGMDGAVIVLLLASIGQLLVALAMAPWRGLRLREMQPFGPMLAGGLIVVAIGLFQ
jgi:leader peptidase (prepilin peptidase)/N-methyltransferase